MMTMIMTMMKIMVRVMRMMTMVRMMMIFTFKCVSTRAFLSDSPG